LSMIFSENRFPLFRIMLCADFTFQSRRQGTKARRLFEVWSLARRADSRACD
jgi:hypothetical protein